MRYAVIDIETDGLYQTVSKMHCLSYQILEENERIDSGTFTDYQDMVKFIQGQEKIVGHNVIRYDIPVLEKLLGIKYEGKVIDTLAISWYIFPERNKHGLEGYGDEFNVPKPVINDWNNLSVEEYIHRCETDVEINTILWLNQKHYLEQLYATESFDRLVGYLSFKFECLLEQEMTGIQLDTYLCEKTKNDLEFIVEEKTVILSHLMPKDLGNIIKKKPVNVYKKDGSLSAYGEKWFDYLKENNLPEDIEVVRDAPNPGSNSQLKEWLNRLGWIPITFKISKSTNQKVPQVSLPSGGGICPSVQELYSKEPNLKELEGLYVAQHRLGLIKSFLENKDENDRIYATAHGFSNTLRLQHSKPCVNLPGFDKPWGKEIRGCLTVPSQAHIMFGADVSALEDSTKQHYMYFFDPEYVTQMRVPGFDPHLDIAILGELLTEEQAERFKVLDKKKDKTPEEKIEYFQLKEIRGSAKTVNFAGVYGAGPPKIAETLKKPLAFATKLHETYWKRNKAVKQIATSAIVKEVYGQKWLFNPVSGFWYYLKVEKDKFSVLNQGTGSYVFDCWLRKVRIKLKPFSIPIIFQMHDEMLGICLKFQQQRVESLVTEAMLEVNEELKLNVEIRNSIDWGQNYSNVH